ncbi:hypothetical protein JLK41_09150 [Ectopseudomonas khazarica]|uniref:hypothetical protein n=1 Tax=Ectopseudomonas khazarica TaxID=2502979 RepID=UPI001AEF38A3|nr:hypothetical protein [Pseudomonas khazarica]QTS88307.1 hypothetical protein JLK41_09150 [Pseudomonas khazarica]
MPTPADQRRATAEALQRSRQGTSEASRRAAGEAMVARRTGRNEVDDINALVSQPRQRRSLPAVDPRGSVPAQRGRGNYAAPQSTGGGIAAPLTERLRAGGKADRAYYPDGVTFYSNDYMLAVQIQPLHTLTMIDADGAEVPFVFGVPGDV